MTHTPDAAAVLRELEWSAQVVSGPYVWSVCPSCNHDKGQGHASDCRLAAALAAPSIPPDIAKLLDDHANASLFSSVHGDPMRRDLARSALERAYASNDERWKQNLQACHAAMGMLRECVESFGPVASLSSPDGVLLSGPKPHHEAEAIIKALLRIKASHTEPGLRAAIEIMDRQIQAYVTPNSDYSHGVMDMAKAFSKAIRTELDKLADDPIPEEWKSTPPATPDRAEADPIRKALRGALAWGCVYGPVIAHKDWNDMREIMVEQFSAEIATSSGNHPAYCGQCGSAAEDICRTNNRATICPRTSTPSGNHPVVVDDAYNRGYQAGRKVGLAIASRPAPSVATVTDEMVDRAFGAQPNVFGRYISDEDRRIMRLSIEAALGHTAPTGEDIS